jgi:ABC-2 type transport system permease protein
MRLLRPIHPLIAYATSHAAALPFRSMIALPLALILLLSSGASALTHEPLQLALLLPSLVMSWMLTFGIMFSLGSTAFWLTQPYALVNVYFGVWTLLSGYMMPIHLLPGSLGSIAEWLPFYSMLGAPVELMTRSLTHTELVTLLVRQAGWAVACLFLGLAVWRAGVRRFEAVGG